MEVKVFEGKDKEELLKESLKALNLEEKDILYKYEEKKGGLFKGTTYVLSVVSLEEVKNVMVTFLGEMFTKMDIEATFESNIREDKISVKIYSSNNAIIIGKQGQTLKALQTILRQVIFNKIGVYPFISLDVENYKDKQMKHIERLAKSVAREVLKTNIEASLDNMNSYERRVVHSVLSEYNGIYTISEGEEPNRHVVIKPKKDQK